MPAPFRSDGNAELFPTLHLGAASGGRDPAGDTGRRQTSSQALPAAIPSDGSVVDTASGPAVEAEGQAACESAGQAAAKADATGNAGAANLACRCSGARAASHGRVKGRRRTGGRAKDGRSKGHGRLQPAQSGKVSSGKAATPRVSLRTHGPRAVNRNGKRAGAASRGADPDTKARNYGTRGWASCRSPAAAAKTGGCRR